MQHCDIAEAFDIFLGTCLCDYVYVSIIIILGTSDWLKIAVFPGLYATALLGSQWKAPALHTLTRAVLNSLLGKEGQTFTTISFGL